jgi:ribosome-binding protein aMBF1 (putative translation factor)
MTKTITSIELISQLLSDEVKAEYDRMKPVTELAWTLVEARNRAKMTQAEVAKKMGTTQSVVARIESGRTSPTMETVSPLLSCDRV